MQGSSPAPTELCPGCSGDDAGFISILHNQASTGRRHALLSRPQCSVKATISAVAGRRAHLLACFMPLYRSILAAYSRSTYMHTHKQPHTTSSTDPGQHLLHTLN